jgi:hypothetical protein
MKFNHSRLFNLNAQMNIQTIDIRMHSSKVQLLLINSFYIRKQKHAFWKRELKKATQTNNKKPPDDNFRGLLKIA